MKTQTSKFPDRQLLERCCSYLLIFAALPFVTSCSVFMATRKLDISPFADGTVTLTKEIRYQMARTVTVYIRPYLGVDAVREADALAREVRASIQATVDYSIALSNLASRNVSPVERAEAYPEIFKRLTAIPGERGWADFSLSRQMLDSIASEASAQRKLLDAVRVADPAIEEFVRSAGRQLDALEATFDNAILQILQGIEASHAPRLSLERDLKGERFTLLQDIGLILKYLNGDLSSLNGLKNERPFVDGLLDLRNPTLQSLVSLESYLLERIETVKTLLGSLSDDRELYVHQLQETEQVNRDIRQKLLKARIALISWRRAHGQLAQGETDPAKINAGAIAASLVGKALP